MKVVWTAAAQADLDDILAYTSEHYPSVVPALEQRVRAIEARIGRWPHSAREVEERPGIRVVPLVRYPYRIFYQVVSEGVEVLHIHHAAKEH
jgi:toxin ParE1/3/4